MMDKTIIREFWRWFENNERRIREVYESNPEALNNVLSPALRRLFDGRLSYEVGPGDESTYYLALSPAGDRSTLELTKQIVQEAPTVPSWEFLPAKKSRSWGYKLQISDQGELLNLDIAQWRYSLTSYNNKAFFDVTFFVPLRDIRRFQESTLEATVIELIGRVSVRPLDGAEYCRLPSFEVLAKHLGSLGVISLRV
jgi:hypothetical protein